MKETQAVENSSLRHEGRSSSPLAPESTGTMIPLATSVAASVEVLMVEQVLKETHAAEGSSLSLEGRRFV